MENGDCNFQWKKTLPQKWYELGNFENMIHPFPSLPPPFRCMWKSVNPVIRSSESYHKLRKADHSLWHLFPMHCKCLYCVVSTELKTSGPSFVSAFTFWLGMWLLLPLHFLHLLLPNSGVELGWKKQVER